MQIKKNGFTLVEVLIVIAIIAVLATLGITNFAAASQKARDSVRKSDVSAINQALVLYRSDRGNYPAPGPGNAIPAGDLAPTYIREIPTPPNSVGWYRYTMSVGKQFSLCTKLERDSGNYTGNSITISKGQCSKTGNCDQPSAAAGPGSKVSTTDADPNNNTGCCFCVFSP